MTYLGIIISAILAVLTWLDLFGLSLTIWQILTPFFVLFGIDIALLLFFGVGMAWIGRSRKRRR